MADSTSIEEMSKYAAEETESEITQLKEKFGTDCRVIDNIGEFLHVISISFKDWDVKVKFQITGEYPTVPAEIVVSGAAGTDVDSMTTDLYEFLQSRKHTVASVTDHVTMAHQWLLQNGVAGTSSLVSSIKKKKAKKSKSAKNEDQNVNKKKPSMKTAEDVIKRILWDIHVNQEDFIIGYVDRFLGLMEKSFCTFSWDDIASVDDFTALAIPKHRIQYFKYQGVVVWDKTKRLDNVFGSTGSGHTLSDVKQQLLDGTICAEKDELANDCETDRGTRSDLDSDDSDKSLCDDDDSDIEVHFDGLEVNSSQVHARLLGGQQRLNEELMGGRKRPNYFVCVRITNPDIIANVEALQTSITAVDPRLVSCYSRSTVLHMTVCTVGLDTDYQVRNACQALNEGRTLLEEIARRQVTCRVAGVDHFYGRVIYAKVKQTVILDEFVTRVRGILTNAGVEIRDGYDFVPHVTVMKLSRSMDHTLGINRLPPFTYRNFREMVFGVQTISSIDLCAMSNERADNGYYVMPLHLELLQDWSEQPA